MQKNLPWLVLPYGSAKIGRKHWHRVREGGNRFGGVECHLSWCRTMVGLACLLGKTATLLTESFWQKEILCIIRSASYLQFPVAINGGRCTFRWPITTHVRVEERPLYRSPSSYRARLESFRGTRLRVREVGVYRALRYGEPRISARWIDTAGEHQDRQKLERPTMKDHGPTHTWEWLHPT